ncbi:MAG: hypothetical protein RL380_108 [Verrucomicrobiota bacterium]
MNFRSPTLAVVALLASLTGLRAQLKLSAPVSLNASNVQFTLAHANPVARYALAQSSNGSTWTPAVVGAVGQTNFTLPKPVSAALFFRAQQINSLVPPVGAIGLLTSSEVSNVLAQAITRARFFVTNGTATNATVAVVDREGYVVGVWSFGGASASALDVLDAITKAGTAAFLSSKQEAFTSRTAGFIVQQNYPPGILNAGPGPLVGVNFANLTFSDVNRFKNPNVGRDALNADGGTNGAAISPLGFNAISGLAGSPGGVPLYKNGTNLIGGVAAVVTGKLPIPALADIQVNAAYDVDEDVALAGQKSFEPSSTIFGSGVLVGGIRFPYVSSTTTLGAVAALGSFGDSVVPGFPLTNSPYVAYVTTNLGGVTGELRAPIVDDPLPGLIDGEPRLTSLEVSNILTLAAQRAATTRAGIRLPAGVAAQVFITVVNNPNTPGVAPSVLGTFRTPDATIFSWDVAVQKARTALYFSRSNSLFGTNAAVSSRAVGFLAQAFYPPGINGNPPGPWLGLQEKFSLIPAGVTNPLNGVVFTTPPAAADPNLPNGITIFPGGFPLYRHGKLIGAIGVSGDGIDQDDLISASGTVNFLPPTGMMSDNFFYGGARLPYAKFPRNPSL